MPFESKETHPSYGMISFHRIRGGNNKLFGSSVPHDEKIMLTLSHAEFSRDLSQEWYFPKGTIVEVEMSYTQFAEAISTMNAGGVPVTITYTEKDGKAGDCDFEVSRKKYEDEFQNLLAEANKETNDLIRDLTTMFESGKLNKREREEILSKLHRISTDINENASFVYRQFNQQLDKSSLEAKNEVEAFVQHKVQSLGLKKLQELHNDTRIEEKNYEKRSETCKEDG